jgi:hypothetical protein
VLRHPHAFEADFAIENSWISFLQELAGRVACISPNHRWPLLGGRATGDFRMKWFWIALALAIFLLVDHVYADGRGAGELYSIVEWVGTSIRHWSDDLLRPLRR